MSNCKHNFQKIEKGDHVNICSCGYIYLIKIDPNNPESYSGRAITEGISGEAIEILIDHDIQMTVDITNYNSTTVKFNKGDKYTVIVAGKKLLEDVKLNLEEEWISVDDELGRLVENQKKLVL